MRARAEARAAAARSHLTTAELIRAARKAGARLPVHQRPQPPKDIRVHPPIIRRAPAGSRRHAGGGNAGQGQAVAAQELPGSGALPGVRAVPATVSPLVGQVNSPQNEGQTSTTFSMQAQLTGGCGTPCSATTYSGVTFQYRVGTSGSFASIPASAVMNGGSQVTWPATTIVMSSGQGVNSPNLTWTVPSTLSSSGLLQIQAQFTDGIGDSYTTSPVTVTFNKLGTGGDFAVAPVGPAMVGLQSGNMALSAADVSIPGYGMGLSLARTFNSLTPSAPSIFGPGWTASFPVGASSMNWASVTDDGSYAVLADSNGSTYTFAAGTPSGGITPYTAQGTAAVGGLTLTKSSGFTLADPSGDQTTFVAANANAPSLYTPSQVTVPGTSRSAGYIYDATTTDASYGDPLLMVGPNANLAQGTSSTSACPNPPSASTWANGCRALQFSYNASGRLTQVTFAYQQSGVLTTTAVAGYGYDTSGRLTSEWDPRISPNLVTSYTYDEATGDANYGRITSYSPAQSTAGSLAPWTFSYNTTSGSAAFGKLISASRAHSGTGGTSTQTVVYGVPLTTAAGGPVNMDAATVGTWNQTDVPASSVAIFPGDHVPSSPPSASDWHYAQISYYDGNGLEVNTASFGSAAWNIDTSQYDGFGGILSQLTAADRAEALAAGSNSAAVAAELSTVTDYTTSADGSELTDHVYGPLHNASVPGQGIQQIRNETHLVYDEGAPAGGPFDLATTKSEKASLGAGIPGTSEADVYTTDYVYNNGTDNTGWTLRSPMQTVVGPLGLTITSTTVYNENPNLYGGEPLVTATCMPSDTTCSGAGTMQYIYYTGGANSLDASCGGHAMWADLVCKTEPAAQPGTAGLPSLPVTSYTYNIYQQPLTKTETFGSSTRTTTYSYDPSRLMHTATVTTSGSGMGTAVQEMVDNYSSTTDMLLTQQTKSGTTVTGQISYGSDDFGQLKTYTDGSSNVTTYGYDLAGRVTSRNDGKGTVTVSYDTNGLPTSEVDSQAGTFTAAYNPDGGITTQTYPGGLTASYGYDETGATTSLSYAGQSWTSPLSQTVVPDTHGNWASQSVTDTSKSLSDSQAYTYDKADRLSTTQDTLSGQCATRTYTYNANSDRTLLATAPPGTGGACQTTNPVSIGHSYDSADRLTNTGYTYDSQGDITTTPSSDAGGSGNLTATYYANDMLGSQSQNGQTITWSLDPTESRFASSTVGGVTYTSHYSDSGNSSTWVAGSDGSWIRHVTDFNGLLAAQVTASGTTLELSDLHGDVMATDGTSSTSTGPTQTYVYNEFGGQETGSPGQYGWLGADQISGSALGGQLLMGVRAYNPGTGRFSQVDPISGGSANAYDYALQNPVTNTDLTGLWNWQGRWCQSVAAYRAYRFCVYYIDQYWTRQIELILELGIAFSAACAILNPELAIACAWVGLAAAVALAFIHYYDNGGGIYIKYYEWRAVWWFFGWHHGRWHIYWAWLGGQ
jgi:RHS repeat-associated protein